VTVFHDKDPDNTARLQSAIARPPGIEKFRHKPAVWNLEVGQALATELAKLQVGPTYTAPL